MTLYDFIVDGTYEGKRLDSWIALQDEVDITRSFAAKLIDDGNVLVNGKPAHKSVKLTAGDEVTLNLPDPVGLSVEPENIPLDIVYEDSDLLVVNKPKGMVVHPAAGNYQGTLVNALLWHCKGELSGINGVIRPGIVHRIDKNTSGLLIVAKTDKAHLGLAEQIKAHSFTREYEAICTGGRFKEESGTIDAPIGRDKNNRKRMCVTDINSRSAVTHYTVLEELYERSLGICSYVNFRLETGRTHQIRVHSAYIGHPILGDDVYGKPYKGCEGQCLHARKVGFIHPISGEYLEFTSELPGYFVKLLEKMRDKT
ncbi:MAG: RluA family pseudouridine synthase [Oscillospiraceae bacterium]|nr:RluA family pseudouridine synthase [Oscillospiraceae bacterium]